MAIKKKLTVNQAEWKKEVRRLKQFMRRAGKRGFTFEPDLIPEKPSRVTAKQLRVIKALTPAKLYEHATYQDVVSGETLTGTQGRALERHRASVKAAKTRAERVGRAPAVDMTVLYNVQNMIMKYEPPQYWSEYWQQVKRESNSILMDWLQSAIEEEGEAGVARRLQEAAARINDIIETVQYDSEQEQAELSITEFAAILKGSALNNQELQILSDQGIEIKPYMWQ